MIDFIKGLIAFKSPTYVVLETSGGVGYRVNISLHTYSKIEKEETVRLLTHLQIKEDAHALFGFAEDTERTIFQHLISVSGVGTTTAQVLLSAMNPDEVRAAILGENEAAFNKVKGIGPKTAKRLILELKEKMKKDGGADMAQLSLSVASGTMRDEAIAALTTLGYPRIAVQKTLNKILNDQKVASVEDLIKLGLKQMM